jgi:hypothetical protein
MRVLIVGKTAGAEPGRILNKAGRILNKEQGMMNNE